MKQKFLAIGTLVMLSGVATYAQTKSDVKPSLIIKGGLNLSNITINKDGDLDEGKTLTSFHAGLVADLPISRIFSIQPGVLFTGKGAKLESGNTSGDNWYRSTTRPYYIEIPVNAVFKVPLGQQSSFFVGAGPYLGIGVGGKNKVEGEVLGVNFSRSSNIKFSDDDPFTSAEEGAGYNIMRRFDYGLNGTVGIESKFALFSVNYGLGLAKLQSGTTSSNDELNKYRVLSFSVGFKL
jgi:Outer membrane protein beta-barrel domain